MAYGLKASSCDPLITQIDNKLPRYYIFAMFSQPCPPLRKWNRWKRDNEYTHTVKALTMKLMMHKATFSIEFKDNELSFNRVTYEIIWATISAEFLLSGLKKKSLFKWKKQIPANLPK